MAEQVDLRSVVSIIRRRLLMLAAVAVVGALVGVGLVTWHPPLYSSTSKILLQPTVDATTGESAAWDAGTQVNVAQSDAVLAPAAAAVSPPLSRREVRHRVSATAPTADLLAIEARGRTGDEAADLAQAVAEAEVAYQTETNSSLTAAERTELGDRRTSLEKTLDVVDSQVAGTRERLDQEDAGSAIGRQDASTLAQLIAQETDLVLAINQLDTKIRNAGDGAAARIIEPASPATRPNLLLWYVAGALGAGLVALLLALIVLVSLARRDAMLATRDEIADAIGSEVLASMRTQAARTVAGWLSLLETYAPSVAEGWMLRSAFASMGLGELAMGHPDTRRADTTDEHHLICVVSLADDGRALSVGPQLASYAASIGISTLLVPEQGDATAALWAACSSQPGEEDLRPHLRVASRRRTKRPPELTVLVRALDRKAPRLPRLSREAVVVLAVSSRAASSEDLARAAVAAYESGFRIAGVLVADPDPLDKTTGRQLHERLQQPPLPSRGGGPRAIARPHVVGDSSRTGGAS
ncbi:MAG: hypothetical protein ABIO16_14590 [Nocardioides sp.]